MEKNYMGSAVVICVSRLRGLALSGPFSGITLDTRLPILPLSRDFTSAVTDVTGKAEVPAPSNFPDGSRFERTSGVVTLNTSTFRFHHEYFLDCGFFLSWSVLIPQG